MLRGKVTRFSSDSNYTAKLNGQPITINRMKDRKAWQVANEKEVILVVSDRRELEDKLGLIEDVRLAK